MTDSTFTKNFCPTSALIKQFHRGKFSNYFSLMQVFHSKKITSKIDMPNTLPNKQTPTYQSVVP